jgi:hypothetical protein
VSVPGYKARFLFLSDSEKRLFGMRADDDAYQEYADAYSKSADEMDREPNWDLFDDLWDKRLLSDEDMAHLLAEVLGEEYEDTLAWVTIY